MHSHENEPDFNIMVIMCIPIMVIMCILFHANDTYVHDGMGIETEDSGQRVEPYIKMVEPYVR